jgi:hypothetical protein
MVDKSEKFRWLVRLGYAARGLVYVLIGYLALSSARGDHGPTGAFNWLQDAPLGKPLLYLAALGLLAYALFKLASFAFDIENHGTDRKGIFVRVGHAASGIAHLVLAYTAFQFAQGGRGGSGDGAQEAAGTVLSVGFGPLVLGLIGLGFLAAAFVQGKAAVTRQFMRHLSGRTPPVVETLGRIGLAARAVVFTIIAWSLVRGAWFNSSSEVKTLGDAVNSLAGQGTLYTLVAAGLLVFGVFSLFSARYRIVPDVQRSDLRPTLH